MEKISINNIFPLLCQLQAFSDSQCQFYDSEKDGSVLSNMFNYESSKTIMIHESRFTFGVKPNQDHFTSIIDVDLFV